MHAKCELKVRLPLQIAGERANSVRNAGPGGLLAHSWRRRQPEPISEGQQLLPPYLSLPLEPYVSPSASLPR